MLFELQEKNYQLDLASYKNVELCMAGHFEEQGWQAIHHDYYLFHESKKTKYPKNEKTLSEIIGEDKLRALRQTGKALYPEGLGPSLRPEQPDLFVYDSKGNYFFCEVKRRKTGDFLRAPQMIGISLIYSFLGISTELAVVSALGERQSEQGKTYSWVWPAVQECGFHKVELTA